MPIWLENVDCSGTENFIDHCQLESWGNTSCEHSQDAGVVCTREWGVALCVCVCVCVCALPVHMYVRTYTHVYVSWLCPYVHAVMCIGGVRIRIYVST